MNQSAPPSSGNAASTHGPEVAPVEAWDAIAASYDRFVAPGEARIAIEALRLAGLEPGHRFLDVAAGTGGLSLPAARLGARVVATDWSARMIELLEARARDEGLRDVEACVMDCHALDFAADTFDVTGSLFGVMLVPDQPRALREMARVTRPGGHVLVIAYAKPTEFEALHFFIDALRTVAPDFEGLPDDPPPLEFQVADPDVMRRRFLDAGLKSVVVETSLEERIEVGSGRALWDWCLGGNPIPNELVATLTAEQRRAVLAALDEQVTRRAGRHGSAVLTAPLNVGIGTK